MWWPDVLLHAGSHADGPAGDPVVNILLVVGGVFAAAVAGIHLGRWARAQPRLAVPAIGFSVGALLFLFFDLLKEAASLGQGLVHRPLLQLGLLAAFAVGALAIPALAARRPGDPLLIAWLWTLGISAHGAGEGWVVGTEAAHASLLVPLQAVSFLVHKAVEAFTIPLVGGAAVRAADAWLLAGLMAVVALVSSVAALVLGPGVAPLVFFAVGAGATVFAVMRLSPQGALTPRHMAAIVVGVMFIYAAGLLHEL